MIKLIHNKFETTPQTNIGEIDLIIMDPPDNIGMKYDEFIDLVSANDYANNIRLWLSRAADLTKGPVFFTFNEKWTRVVENAIESVGIPLIQRLQWYYTFGQDQTRIGKYALCHRPIYWLNSNFIQPDNIKVPSARQAKYKDKRAAPNGKIPENIWQFSRIAGTFRERRPWVPTQLPEALVERIIRGHCRPGGCVLDPFLGSGTTALVCRELGVACVAIDVSRPYIEKAAEILGISKGDIR